MRRFVRGWRPMLRIARREAVRARGRSALVLVMIALPVLAVVALDTLGRTAQVTAREGLDRKLGAADALVNYEGDTFPVDQNPDLSWLAGQASGVKIPSPDQNTIAAVLGARSRVIPISGSEVAVRTPAGVARPGAIELDLTDSMTTGLFDVREGRMPQDETEVAVSPRLAARGFDVGDSLPLESGQTRRVSGIVESTSTLKQSTVLGLPGSLGVQSSDSHRSWLVHRPGGVDWAMVKELNSHGLYVMSRKVIENPPPASEITIGTMPDAGMGSNEIAVLGLVVAMALLEVVLLAGPAFAVGARQQQRSLALILATGGERRDVKRAVLAAGLVLGLAAAVIGAAAGVVVAWLTRPLVQGFSTEVLGPFELSVRDVLAIAVCGLLSAVLAAVAPAMLAARQDVVAVLAGRRGDTRARLRSPVAGAVLLAGGIGLATFGARTGPGGEMYIAVAAVLSVVGMVLLIPLVIAHLGRIARVLPLPARYAVRDAGRHRGRTAPAVAAIAATVAGIVALGIAGVSDAEERRATYMLSGPIGAAVVHDPTARPDDWAAMRTAISARLPDARVRAVTGIRDVNPVDEDLSGAVESIDIQLLGNIPDGSFGNSNNFGAGVLVGADSLDTIGVTTSEAQRDRALDTLDRGGVVMFAPTDDGRTTATVFKLRAERLDTEPQRVDQWNVPAMVVTVPGTVMPALAVVSNQVAERAGLTASVIALIVDGITVTNQVEDELAESMRGFNSTANVFVERGFQDNSTRIVLLLLATVGGVLVLGGTLTATFLALSDARPDFATMSAIGAAPRTRRFVAAAYAGTIGLVGAVLGAAVGFIPGIAITFPLTSAAWLTEGSTSADGTALPDHFIDVPWLLIVGIVLVLPLVTAAIVGLTSRSRLPMISRLS